MKKQCNDILKDVSGKSWVIKAAAQSFVYFDFNPVGDNIKVYSSLYDWERNYEYDMLGRKTHYFEENLSEEYAYNGNNLAYHVQTYFDNIINDYMSKTTNYSYTAHRLESVNYEDGIGTYYNYNAYGQVESIYDESGKIAYEYGNMGEITQETRNYALPFLTNTIALNTQFEYDSWGRVQKYTTRHPNFKGIPKGANIKYLY